MTSTTVRAKESGHEGFVAGNFKQRTYLGYIALVRILLGVVAVGVLIQLVPYTIRVPLLQTPKLGKAILLGFRSTTTTFPHLILSSKYTKFFIAS